MKSKKLPARNTKTRNARSPSLDPWASLGLLAAWASPSLPGFPCLDALRLLLALGIPYPSRLPGPPWAPWAEVAGVVEDGPPGSLPPAQARPVKVLSASITYNLHPPNS